MDSYGAILIEPERIERLNEQLRSVTRTSIWNGIVRVHAQLAIRDFFARQIDEGLASVVIPKSLASELAEAFDWLASGYVTNIVTPADKRPGARTSPKVIQCQIEALAYIELAKQQHIADRYPTKTIIEIFGITRQVLTHWRKALISKVPEVVRLRLKQPPEVVSRDIKSLSIAYRRSRHKPIEKAPPAVRRSRYRAMRANRSASG